MNKKISLGAAIAFMLIVAAVTFSLTMVYSERMFNGTVSDLKDRERRYSKIAEIDDLVRENYIGALDQTALMDALSAGYLAGTGDQYAEYYSAARYARMQNNQADRNVQIGISTIRDESGYVQVREVYPDSPAEAAGIESGALIVKIDDLDITTDNYNEAVNSLQGEAGTNVNVVVRRDTEDVTLQLTRRFVEVPSVTSTMLDSTIGLVKITEFNDNTPEQFTRIVDALIDQGANALIFDVRNVETGTLRSVAQVLDKLLPEGPLVSSVDKSGTITVLEQSDAREVALPMAVLINERTSGEAELFAQAISDYGKGRLVGTRTMGKGTMQRTYVLLDGSAVRLTSAQYKPPVSASYDKVGVQPDFEVKMTEEQYAVSQQGYQDMDTQLKKAIEVAMASMRSAGIDFTSQVISSSSNASQETGGTPPQGEADVIDSSQADEDGDPEDRVTDSGEQAIDSDSAQEADVQDSESEAGPEDNAEQPDETDSAA